MTKIENQIEIHNKILIGLRIAYDKLLVFKKNKNSELVIMRDNKIVRIKPVDFEKMGLNKDENL